ncbi:MAG: cytochrome oxidase assembly protein [Proteobacteria bacterium]|nr:cytochrome oxidase assembly protein [Pseudomonadota bacterium]
MNRGQRMLVGLAALFLAPLGVSFLIYYGHGSLSPGKRLNHGELLEPVQPLRHPELTLADGSHPGEAFFRHHWTLLFAGDGRCDARCGQALYDTRQVRLALNRDASRVQRLFLASGQCCDFDELRREHPDLAVARVTPGDALLAQLPGDPGNIYLIDPLGNLVMRYGADAPAKGMLEDLKRLLKLSQIG